MLKRLILLQVLAVLFLFVDAQVESTIEQLEKETKKKIRTNEPVNEKLNMVCKGSNFNLFGKTGLPCFSDTFPTIRKQATHYLANTSLNPVDKEDLRKSTDYFLQNGFDQNSGDVDAAFNYLKRYHIDSYNTKTIT